MPDFKFFKIPNTNRFVILDPKRAHRPHVGQRKHGFCPFCPNNLAKEKSEVYRVGGEAFDTNWQTIVVPNKFPFAPIHEIVVHTSDHKGWVDLSLDELKLGIGAYINRFNHYKEKGTVCIFANSGKDGGESIGHAHSQIAVIPPSIKVEIPQLEKKLSCYGDCVSIADFSLLCPAYSQWPDEVWIVPHVRGEEFGKVSYAHVESLAFILKRLIRIFDLRHNGNFPFNTYIYPKKDWYVRLVSRAKILGGFEIETGIFVNTQDPTETSQFIKDHFYEEDDEKIRISKARYRRGV